MTLNRSREAIYDEISNMAKSILVHIYYLYFIIVFSLFYYLAERNSNNERKLLFISQYRDMNNLKL